MEDIQYYMENWECPEDWTRSVFVPLREKGITQRCKYYRTIALISHASKVIIIIWLERIKGFLELPIAQKRAGFRRGKGTRGQILNVRKVIDKATEVVVPIYICFLDYSKSFCCVSWTKLCSEKGATKHIMLI